MILICFDLNLVVNSISNSNTIDGLDLIIEPGAIIVLNFLSQIDTTLSDVDDLRNQATGEIEFVFEKLVSNHFIGVN